MKKIFSPLKCKQAPSYGSMASVWVHGEHCAQHQSYLDGQSDVCISTKAASPVAGAVMETSSWGREKSTGPIKASRSAQVWRAPLFSTTITGNLKEAVIEFIAAYGNCYWSLEAQQWGYWYQNGTIQLLRECLKCRNAEGRREGVKIFEESEPFFQVRSCSPCLLPRHPEIHSTAAWSEIWTTVQRWSRRIWLAVICVDGWKCPQPRGKTAWTQTFLPSFTPLKIVWKPPTLKKRKRSCAVYQRISLLKTESWLGLFVLCAVWQWLVLVWKALCVGVVYHQFITHREERPSLSVVSTFLHKNRLVGRNLSLGHHSQDTCCKSGLQKSGSQLVNCLVFFFFFFSENDYTSRH